MKRVVFFKRVAIVIIVLAVSISAISQEKGDIAVGANLAISAGNEVAHTGYGAKMLYNIRDDIRLEPSYTKYNNAEKEIPFVSGSFVFSSREWGLNAHYLFRPAEEELDAMPWMKKIVIYPLAGIGLLNVKCHYSRKGEKSDIVSANAFGVNFGIGTDICLINRLFLSLQTKVMLASVKFEDAEEYEGLNLGSRYMMSLGLIYKLN